MPQRLRGILRRRMGRLHRKAGGEGCPASAGSAHGVCHFVRDLHRRLPGDVWEWGGRFRLLHTNIGIAPEPIAMQLRIDMDNLRYRWEEVRDLQRESIWSTLAPRGPPRRFSKVTPGRPRPTPPHRSWPFADGRTKPELLGRLEATVDEMIELGGDGLSLELLLARRHEQPGSDRLWISQAKCRRTRLPLRHERSQLRRGLH
ncbi:hypothetical protein BH11MYX1_BH11MYX1_51100 [soil metagenome]